MPLWHHDEAATSRRCKPPKVTGTNQEWEKKLAHFCTSLELFQEEVEARLEAEKRLREAEASLARLEKAVEKQVTRKKTSAAETKESPQESGAPKSAPPDDQDNVEQEMIADVRTLKSKQFIFALGSLDKQNVPRQWLEMGFWLQ